MPVNRHMLTYSNQQFLPLIDGKIDAIIARDGSGRFVAETSPTGMPAYRSEIGID
jgi:hypothetical protein